MLARQGGHISVLSSHVVFNEQGLVTMHRDCWDAAKALYEKLPVVGVMLWLKKRVNA